MELPPSPEQDYPSISELLFAVAKEAKRLDDEAQRKLIHERDTGGYTDMTRQRAQLLVDLPTLLVDYQAGGGSVPAEAIDFAVAYSTLAQQALDTDNLFAMGVLLDPMGAKVSDPNDLERLIERLVDDK